MSKPLINILLNSTMAFVSAFIFTTFFHEFGHYLSYSVFGENPTLFHNYVQTPGQQLGIGAKLVSALAGPVSSLMQGIVLALVVYKKQENTARNLFYLWLSLLGFVNFFGYLVMTPFSTVGDTGKAAELMRLDHSVRSVIAFVGLVLAIWVIRKVGKNFSVFIPADCGAKLRTKYVYHIMFFPIMIGSILNTLLAFPVAALLSVIYPATSSYVIMSSFDAILKNASPQPTKPEFEDRLMKSVMLLLLSAILLNRLLTTGVG